MSEFRDMRRKRQQLSEAESIGILQKATSGTLALLGDNGYPYAVPISYVYHEGKLYFHSALSGHKVDAIRQCDKASFCVIELDDVQPKKYTTFTNTRFKVCAVVLGFLIFITLNILKPL